MLKIFFPVKIICDYISAFQIETDRVFFFLLKF